MPCVNGGEVPQFRGKIDGTLALRHQPVFQAKRQEQERPEIAAIGKGGLDPYAADHGAATQFPARSCAVRNADDEWTDRRATRRRDAGSCPLRVCG
jgi:hypothetical protein